MHICVVSAEFSLLFIPILLDENLYFHVGSQGNISKSIQSKVVVPVLSRRLMVLNIYVKFHENISNDFEVTERTRVCGKNCKTQSNNSQRMQSRVTVPALYTSSRPP